MKVIIIAIVSGIVSGVLSAWFMIKVFVLAAAMDIDELHPVVILSGGTDGTDGPTNAAGAIRDGDTVHRAQKLSLNPVDYLNNNNAYPFFKTLGDLLITGATNTNVMDLRIILVGEN